MSVSHLSDYRKPPKVKKNNLDLPRWFCIRCDTDIFKILDTGAIHCAQCHGVIRQLKAVDLG